MGLEKERGGGLTSVVYFCFDKRGVDCIMSYPNADLIAVSLACPKDAKSPSIWYVWGLLTALLEFVEFNCELFWRK